MSELVERLWEWDSDPLIREARVCIQKLEREVLEQARLNGMGSEREARQLARIEKLERALREAVGWFQEYMEMHHAAGKQEKALRNQRRAQHLNAVLEKGKQS